MTLVCKDLEEADNCLDSHWAVLMKLSSWIDQAQKSCNFVGDWVTVIKGAWDHGKFLKFKALLEHMDKQESLIQDLHEEVAILKGDWCRCFNMRSGLSRMADGELEYVDEGAKVWPSWSSTHRVLISMLSTDGSIICYSAWIYWGLVGFTSKFWWGGGSWRNTTWIHGWRPGAFTNLESFNSRLNNCFFLVWYRSPQNRCIN